MINNSIIICSCCSTEHQIVFHYGSFFEKDYPNEVYMQVHLVNWGGFWERFKHAWKYFWGYTSKYGAWDEFIVDVDDLHKFEDIVKYLRMIKKEKEKHDKE